MNIFRHEHSAMNIHLLLVFTNAAPIRETFHRSRSANISNSHCYPLPDPVTIGLLLNVTEYPRERFSKVPHGIVPSWRTSWRWAWRVSAIFATLGSHRRIAGRWLGARWWGAFAGLRYQGWSLTGWFLRAGLRTWLNWRWRLTRWRSARGSWTLVWGCRLTDSVRRLRGCCILLSLSGWSPEVY